MRLHLIPELHRHGVDVEADPAVVLARIAAGRRLEVAPGRRGTVEDDLVILSGIPPKILKRWDFWGLLLSEPGVLGGVERLKVLDADTAEALVK